MMFMVSTPSPYIKESIRYSSILLIRGQRIIATPLLPWVVENDGTATQVTVHAWLGKISPAPELYSSLVELCSHIAAILTTVMKAVIWS